MTYIRRLQPHLCGIEKEEWKATCECMCVGGCVGVHGHETNKLGAEVPVEDDGEDPAKAVGAVVVESDEVKVAQKTTCHWNLAGSW